MKRYRTYVLKLPSGGWVEVRRASSAALLGAGHLLSPLLAAAADVAKPAEAEDHPRDPLGVIRAYCEAVLVAPRMPEDIVFEDIAFADAYAIYCWAIAGAGEARPHRRVRWVADDFLPLVRGTVALHLDAACHRYGMRPSVALGVGALPFAVDLDMAVAYRALRYEHDSVSGEVEVEDMYGNTHKVPRGWLSSDVPRDAAVLGGAALDRVARRHAEAEPLALSVGGGAENGMGDGRLARMPTPGSMERAGL